MAGGHGSFDVLTRMPRAGRGGANRPTWIPIRAPKTETRPMMIADSKMFVGGPGKNYVTLKIVTVQGIYGLGDATLNNRETLSAAYLQDYLVPNLIGMYPRNSEDIWQFFSRLAYFCCGRHRDGGRRCDRHGAVGHQGQAGQYAAVSAVRRQKPRRRDGLCPCHRVRPRGLMVSITHYVPLG
jgi:hypothetical protein